MGGKAKQVYVEKRKKREEEWEKKTDDMETKERAALARRGPTLGGG